jgi:DNA-binding IclR family transcriptional regulator
MMTGGVRKQRTWRPSSVFPTSSTPNSDAVQRLLRMLASKGLFAQDADGRFALTPIADALRSDAARKATAFAALRAQGLVDFFS